MSKPFSAHLVSTLEGYTKNWTLALRTLPFGQLMREEEDLRATVAADASPGSPSAITLEFYVREIDRRRQAGRSA